MRTLLMIMIICPLLLRGQVSWSRISNVPPPNRGFNSCILIDSSCFLTCGLNTLGTTDEVWKYQINSNTWIKKNKFPYKLADLNSATIAPFGYIICPQDSNGNNTHQTWRYNPAIDKWENLKECPLNTAVGFAFSYNSNIYYGLGLDSNGHDTQREVWQYDISTNAWKSLSPFLGSPNRLMSTVVVDSFAYLIGGLDDNIHSTNTIGVKNEFWRYNIKRDTWDSLPKLPGFPRLGGCVFGFKNFLLMGFGLCYFKKDSVTTIDSALNDMYKFDFATQTWSSVNIPVNISGIAPINTYYQYNHKCYMMGGINSNSPLIIDTGVYVMDPSPLHPIWLDSNVATGVQDIPQGYEVLSLYPNPATHDCHLRLSLPAAAVVDVTLLDMTGRVVQSITHRHYDSGVVELTFRTDSYAAGMYMVQVSDGVQVMNRKLSIAEE